MSPLAHLRQAATCSVIASFTRWALARLAPFAGVALLARLAPLAGVALLAGPVLAAQQAAVANSASALAATAALLAPAATSASAAPTAGAGSSGTAVTAASSAQAINAASTVPAAGSASSAQATNATSTVPAAGSALAPPTAPSERSAQLPQPVQLVPDVAAPIAHSALLTVEATETADALQLSIRRASDKSLINSDDVTVAVDGRNQSVTHEKGVYELPINDLRGDGARDVDITVAHDGIREIVSGKVSMTEASSASSLFRDHKQVAWWILNIVIVLVAAIAFSRRKG